MLELFCLSFCFSPCFSVFLFFLLVQAGQSGFGGMGPGKRVAKCDSDHRNIFCFPVSCGAAIGNLKSGRNLYLFKVPCRSAALLPGDCAEEQPEVREETRWASTSDCSSDCFEYTGIPDDERFLLEQRRWKKERISRVPII